MNRPVLICIAAVALSGCHTRPETVVETAETRRAIVVSPETVSVAIPLAVMQRTTCDSVSLLTTPLARSEARVNPDGTLTHSLQHLDTTVTAVVPRTRVYTESREAHERTVAAPSPSPTRWLWPLILLASAIIYLKINYK